MRQINIYRWTKSELPYGNFGDEITIPLLERVFGIKAVPVETHRAELLGAGSILTQHYKRITGKHPRLLRRLRLWLETSHTLYVWGTGIVRDDMPAVWPQRLEICAVRGSLTAGHLGISDTVLGDPGILASRVLDRPPKKQYRVALVPHYRDAGDVAAVRLPSGWSLIDPRRPVMDVVKGIGSADLVVSSSLHGLIVADAFAVPCVWASPNQPLSGTPALKFKDHETARRQSFNEPLNYADAMAVTTTALCDLATMPGRDVTAWQEELIGVFPFR